MSSSAATRTRRGQVPRPAATTERVLSAAEVSELAAANRNRRTVEDEHIGQLPSLYEQTRQQGYKQGLSDLMSELYSTFSELRDYKRDREIWLQQFVFAIVRKVISNSESASIVPSIVQRVIEDCDRGLTSIVVHVHPSVKKAVTERISTLTIKGLVIDIEPDQRLTETGCEIHTPFGIIDAGLETQLDALQCAMQLPDSAESNE